MNDESDIKILGFVDFYNESDLLPIHLSYMIVKHLIK